MIKELKKRIFTSIILFMAMIFCVLTVQISSTSQAAVRAKGFFHFFDWDAGCPIFSRNTLFKTLNLLDFDGFEGKTVKNRRFLAQIL